MGDAAVIVTTPEQLRALIREEVAAALRSVQPAQAEYLDLAGVAELLDVTTTTVRAYVRREGLPVHRIGARTLRFSRAEVEAWLVERASKPGGRAGAVRATIVRLHGLGPQDR